MTDFGEVRKNLSSRRQSGLIRGTPAFIAPEVARRQAYGSPADVWSYGCLLVAMARRAPTGPYATELGTVHSPAACTAVIEKVGNGELHPMSDAVSQLPNSADWPPSVAELASTCVSVEALDRPDFEQIAQDMRYCEPAQPLQTPKRDRAAAAREALAAFRLAEQAQSAAGPAVDLS